MVYSCLVPIFWLLIRINKNLPVLFFCITKPWLTMLALYIGVFGSFMFSATLGSSSCHLGPFWVILGKIGNILGLFWPIWDHLKQFWDILVLFCDRILSKTYDFVSRSPAGLSCMRVSSTFNICLEHRGCLCYCVLFYLRMTRWCWNQNIINPQRPSWALQATQRHPWGTWKRRSDWVRRFPLCSVWHVNHSKRLLMRTFDLSVYNFLHFFHFFFYSGTIGMQVATISKLGFFLDM